jgi:hypothetical protein
MVDERTCNKCLEVLPLSEFSLNSKGKYGVKSICKGCSNKAQRALTQEKKLKDPLGFKRARYLKHILKEYDFTEARYEDLLWEQNNRCAICRVDHDEYVLGSKNHSVFCIDHCHSTGKVRGLLCSVCNSGLGKLKDSPELLERALHYLKYPPYQLMTEEFYDEEVYNEDE